MRDSEGLISSLLQTLSLTCTVCGDPKPQVSWLKGGNEVEPDDQVKSCRKSWKTNQSGGENDAASTAESNANIATPTLIIDGVKHICVSIFKHQSLNEKENNE